MLSRMLKVTVLGFLVSLGVTSPSEAQFEISGAKETIKVDSIPLVVALRKIVPVDYDFSFQTDQDLGKLVSYEYKESWSETLSSLLSDLGLGYSVVENVINIANAQDFMSARPAKAVEEVKTTVVEQVSKIKEVEAPMVEEKVEMMINTPVVEIMPEVKQPVKAIKYEAVEVETVAEVKSTPVVKEMVKVEPKWEVKKGYTLQETIKSWGDKAEWNVVWESDRDFNIQSEIVFSGSFVDAASELITAFEKADPPVVGTFYKNNTLVIETTSNGEVN
ncbi:MAG: TcpQ domain-containing protein [Alphaproteobacteria bacterium]|nr:TcpQ domain-containing protein [Alphaproteobacteria bacterium]